MKWLSDRISYHRHDEYTTILISTKVDKWKEGLLLGWLVLWTLIGFGVLYALLSGAYLQNLSTDTPKSQLQLFLILFLVFWIYYLYKIVKVFWWRKSGVEYFKVDKESLLIKRAYGKVGKASEYLFDNMGELKIIEVSSRSYSYVMQSAFWDMGNETIQFDYFGKQILFGMQLEEKDVKELKKFLNSEIKRYKSKRK